jgi:hypothetical protein
MRRTLATFIVVTCSACAPPAQYGGPIAVDDAGFAARLHRACGLGKAAPTNTQCAVRGQPRRL